MNKFLVWLIGFPLLGMSAFAQSQDGDKNLVANELADGLYMLSSTSGGNLGVSIGEDGTFMIDDKFAADGPYILGVLEELGGSAPQYLVNTHHHGDHTGGNQFFGDKGAQIVAHRLLRDRMKAGYEVKTFNMVVPPAPKAALPSITYDTNMRLHLNGEDIHLIHVTNAHTDNDSIVHFEKANVIHTGDTFFNGFFPFIDTGSSGSLAGVIEALKQVAELANDQTKVIPGHGALASKGDVIITIEMLSLAYKRLSLLKKDGQSLEQAIAVKPLTDIEEKWGGVMFSADQWIGVVWDTL